MSNYVQSTNFATKDNLSSGDPLKIVKGTEINTEFSNIAIAVATKADLASPTFTGTPAAPTASASTNTTQIATTAFVQAAATAVLQVLHPIGSVYINATNSTNPGTLLGFGTWTAFGAGRVPVGFDAGNPLFDAAEETGGSADAIAVSHTHTGTTDSNGSHQHYVANSTGTGASTSPSVNSSNYVSYGNGSSSLFESYNLMGVGSASDVGLTSSNGAHTHTFTTGSAGSSGTNANYQPYITVYMWKRTA